MNLTPPAIARPTDATRLAELIARSFRALSRGYYSDSQIASMLDYCIGLDTGMLDDGTYFIVEADGVAVGCGGWSRRRTLFGGDQYLREDDPLDPNTEPARIRAFFVDPSYARRGIARAIYQACEQAALAEGFQRLALMATLPGEPLYRALGFRELERVDLIMDDGVRCPAVRMEREIRPR